MNIRLKAITVLLAVAPAFGATAQTVSEIETSGRYYHARGFGSTYNEAAEDGMQNLLKAISSNVVVDISKKTERIEKNGEIHSENRHFKSAVMTYSYGHLNDVETLEIRKAPQAEVIRYVRRQDVDRIFNGRREKIYQMVDNGDMALASGKIDCALRNYYWAYCLLNTLPYPSEEKYGGHQLDIWLQEQVRDILSDLRVAVAGRRGMDVDLYFAYKDKPVTSLEFTYNDMGYDYTYAAKDGMGQIELNAASDTTLYNIFVEYAFKSQAKLDPEVDAVMCVLPENSITQAAIKVRPGGQYNVPLDVVVQDRPQAAVIRPQQQRESFTVMEDVENNRPATIAESSRTDNCRKVLDEVVNSVKDRKYDIAPSLFTESGYAQFNGLINYGRARLVGEPVFEFTDFEGYTIARGMQMSFAFRNGLHRNFTEDMVFMFNDAGKICNISFGLGKTVEDNIMAQADIPERTRKYLCMFIENYQTAYALKDLDYISRIFDDYAKIITVSVRPRMCRNVDGTTTVSTELKEHRFDNKYDFLRYLKRGFDSKEFINLRFNRVWVDRADDGREIYGIQLEQDYYSSNYCDHGYLLIGLNLENVDEPSIFVRAWQQEPDENFGLYSLPQFYKGGVTSSKVLN